MKTEQELLDSLNLEPDDFGPWTPEMQEAFERSHEAEERLGARLQTSLLLDVGLKRLRLDFPNARFWETARRQGKAEVCGKVLTRENKYVAFAVEVGSPDKPATPAYVKREFARIARQILADHPELSR